jgi:hypothetical protein
MATVETINELLSQAAARITDAMKELAAGASPSMRSNLARLGAAQVEIFEVQYQLWAVDPKLLPQVPRGPAEDPQTAFDTAMRCVQECLRDGAIGVAIGVIDLFISYQTSQQHVELARQERLRLLNAKNA